VVEAGEEPGEIEFVVDQFVPRFGGAASGLLLSRPAACGGVALHGLLLCLACGPQRVGRCA
jgi:hypothetical protein